MTTTKILIRLTDKQRARLRRLVMDEAKRLGYGTKYTETNRRDWPKALKELRPIATRLLPEDDPRRVI